MKYRKLEIKVHHGNFDTHDKMDALSIYVTLNWLCGVCADPEQL